MMNDQQDPRQQCIFCQIAQGNVPSKQIYTDDKIVVILDINPANPGHLLTLPKEHYMLMAQAPEELLGHIAVISKGLSSIMLKYLGAKGTNLIIANGVTAGQRAPHFVVHLIPRFENDGIQFTMPQQKISKENLKQVKERVMPFAAEQFGIPQKETIAQEKTDLDSITRLLEK